MPTQINGLPAHILLVHAVVILIPLAAAMLVASALWPAARAKLGFLTPAIALIALVFVPVTTNAGHWLQDHLPNGEGHKAPLILRHVNLAGEMLPWAIALFVVSAVVWLLGRRYDLGWRSTSSAPEPDRAPAASGGSTATATATRPSTQRSGTALPVWVTAIVLVVSIVVALGAVYTLYRIGDSGSTAVWKGGTTG